MSVKDNKSKHDSESATDTQQECAQDGVRDTSFRANVRILLLTFYIGMSMFEYGFDKAAIAGFQAMPGFLRVFGYQRDDGVWDIHSGPQQIITSFMTVGSFIGALATGPIGAYLGRRHSIMVSAAIMIVAVALMSETTSFGVLYFARVLTGVANGMLMNFALVYLGETTPPHLRGLCFAIAGFWVTFGGIVGMIVNNETKGIQGRMAYQIPLYVCLPIPGILLLTMQFLPESPRWLLHHKRSDAALKSLQFFRHGAYDDVAVRQEFEEMKVVAAREAETNKDWKLWFEMFKGTNLRRTMIAVGVTCCNAGVGAMFIMSFGTYFLQLAGVKDPFMWAIITKSMGLLGLLISWALINRVGRRRLLLVSCAICTVSSLIIATAYTVPNYDTSKAGVALVFAVGLYLFGFNIGLEPYAFLTSGELPAQNLRAYTLGLSVAASFILAWLCTFTTPYFINPTELNWGPKYAWIWFGSGVISTAFIWFVLPDVNGRSLEEIDEMFRNKVKTRAFKTYVCTEMEDARARGAMNAMGEEKPSGKHIEKAS